MEDLAVRGESTPNPNSRRYLVNRPVQEQAKGRFFTASDAGQEPLVRALFEIDGVSSVMLLPHSVTVSKHDSAAWDQVEARAQQTIEAHFL